MGDALGVPVEFKTRETLKAFPVENMREFGSWNQPKGTWSDDSSLTLCIAEELTKGYDLEKGWVVSDTNKVQVKRLITALKKVKTFPRPHVKDINRKTFSELSKFLEFVESVQCKGTIKTEYGDIVLVEKIV